MKLYSVYFASVVSSGFYCVAFHDMDTPQLIHSPIKAIGLLLIFGNYRNWHVNYIYSCCEHLQKASLWLLLDQGRLASPSMTTAKPSKLIHLHHLIRHSKQPCKVDEVGFRHHSNEWGHVGHLLCSGTVLSSMGFGRYMRQALKDLTLWSFVREKMKGRCPKI